MGRRVWRSTSNDMWPPGRLTPRPVVAVDLKRLLEQTFSDINKGGKPRNCPPGCERLSERRWRRGSQQGWRPRPRVTDPAQEERVPATTVPVVAVPHQVYLKLPSRCGRLHCQVAQEEGTPIIGVPPRTLDIEDPGPSCLVTVRRLTSRRSARSSPTATPRTTRGRSSTPRPERTLVRGSAPPRRRPPWRTSPRSLRSRGALRPPRRTPWRTSPSSSPLRKSPLRPRGALWTAPLPSRPRGGADLDGFVSPPLSLT